MSESIELSTITDWEKFKNKIGDEQEIVIFKHSTRCPVSFEVQNILDRWLSKLGQENIKIGKVDVVSSKELSNRLADESGIKHESPQIIWFDREGKVKWSGSHYRISRKNLSEQLIK